MDEASQPQQQRENHFRFSRLFIPHTGYIVTPLLVVTNIVVYLCMGMAGNQFIAFSPETLLEWGASTRACFEAGQYQRLLISCFVHNGLFHLVLNLPELVFIGYVLEQRTGSRRFLFAYLITGIISSLVSLPFYQNMLSSGASGAILGMYGVLLSMVIFPGIVENNKRIPLLICTSLLAAANLLQDFGPEQQKVSQIFQSIGLTDHAAHWSGFLSGLFIGYLYSIRLSHKQGSPGITILSWAGPGLLSIVCFCILLAMFGFRKSSYTDLRLLMQLEAIEDRANKSLAPDGYDPIDIVVAKTEACNHHLDSCIVLLQTYLASPAADTVNRQKFGITLKYYHLRHSYNKEYIRYVLDGYAPEYEASLSQKQEELEYLSQYPINED